MRFLPIRFLLLVRLPVRLSSAPNPPIISPSIPTGRDPPIPGISERSEAPVIFNTNANSLLFFNYHRPVNFSREAAVVFYPSRLEHFRVLVSKYLLCAPWLHIAFSFGYVLVECFS